MIRYFRQPFPARILYPDAFFRIDVPGRILFLTFDDGPDPVSTPVILDILKESGVTATFFCTGSRVIENPALFARIAAEGHTTGNHGFSHLNGLNTSVRNYCADVFRGRDVTCSSLFRPPYGRLRLRQYKVLERSMRVIFWDVMPYDFDMNFSPESSLAVLNRYIRPGSVIALHDKAGSHALVFLKQFISKAREEGYSFMQVNDNLLQR